MSVLASRAPRNGLLRPTAPDVRELTELTLPVTGELPRQLTGALLGIGPHASRQDAGARQHALVGDAMVHGIRLRDGRAEWYRNRWIRTDRIARGLGELPIPGPRHGLSDNTSGNVIRHAGRTLALGEAGVLPIELDRQLGSVARFDFDGTLPHGFAAHPECDPVTGELFTVAYYHDLPYLEYLVVGVDGRVRKTERVGVRGTPMMHSLSLTDRHVVLYDLPVRFDAGLARAGSRCPYAWQDGGDSRLGVLAREGSGADVRWFDVDPCFVFHPVNAYETGGDLVLDVVRHERVFDRDRLAPGESAPTLWRWTLHLATGTVTERQLDDIPQEFPRVDERVKTMPHRYVYTVASQVGSGATGGSALLKHDVGTGDVAVHDFGPRRTAGEAVFVPRGPIGAEDDGWLMTYVHDADVDRTSLVVLNADDFTGSPQAVVELPVRVPPGLHVNWIVD
ncbi:carotenoid oxygenase family protein [Longispora sp. NPDC051575]|uniref:carotenoid oxygenase family protein n=1 Tax=Longispora sp. NPDC051575 TaxID=3154943 RepID=UPI00341D2F22